MRMSKKIRSKLQRRQQSNDTLITIAKKGLGLTAAAMIFCHTFSPATVQAMPANGQVVAGSAVINQNGYSMSINQLTNKAAINWTSFSVFANETVNFNQPNANAVMLNRVIGNDPSRIFGQLTANGNIFLVNPNGVVFAPGAQVNVGGLLATTHSISDSDFIAGNYKFVSSNTDGKVVNQGTIVAENQGIVALLAPEAVNEGVIVAQKGSVVLASANQATFDFVGDGKVQLVVDETAVKALVANKGLIEVDNGLVLMTASAGRELSSSVVNQSGLIHATSLGNEAGSVELNAVNGTVNVSGTVDATGAMGGSIDVFGKEIHINNTANFDVSGDSGGGNVKIGGDWQGSGSAPHAQNTDIAQGAVIKADSLTKGDGGTVVVWSDGSTNFSGSISATGGLLGGDGGNVETSGNQLKIDGSVDASAANGTAGQWLLDPYNITIAAGSGGSLSSGSYTSNADDSVVGADIINSALSGGTSVTIKTGAGGSQDGNITVNAAISKTGGADATLSLQAHNDIIVNADIKSTSGKLNVDLNSDTNSQAGGTVKINNTATIETNGGSVKIHGGSNETDYSINQTNNDTAGVDIQGSIKTGSGAISIYGKTTADQSNANGVSIAGTLNSDGGTITINGSVDRNDSDTTSSGVIISGTVDAGTGAVDITGMNNNAANFGITTAAGARINGGAVTFTADKMNFASGSLVTANAGSANAVLAIKTLNAAKDVSIGTDNTGGLHLNGSLFSGNPLFQNFSKTVIGSSHNTGTLTVNGASFGNDVTLQAGNIAVAGDLNAAGQTVALNVNSAVISTNIGKITASTLNLQGANTAFTFHNPANAIGTLAGNVKTVNFTNGGTFAVGSSGMTNGLAVSGDSRLSSTNGSINITKDITKSGADATLTAAALNGDVLISDNATIKSAQGKLNVTLEANNVELNNGKINTNGGNASLKASTAIKLTGGNATTGITAGAGNVSFSSNSLSVMDGATPGGSISGTGTLTIDAHDTTKNIGFGNGSSGDLVIAAAAFGTTAANSVFAPGFSSVTIGRTDSTGIVTIGQATVQDKLTVQTGAQINFAANADLRTNDKALTLDAPTINFSNPVTLEAGTGDLTLSADTISSWSNVSFAAVTGGNLYITPKTATRGIYVGGLAQTGVLSVDADAFSSINAGKFDNVRIGKDTGSGAVTIASFTLGNSPTNLLIKSPGGDATFASGANVTMDTSGYLALNVGSLKQPNNISNFTVNNLLLQGTGDFVLNKDGNQIGNIAANVGSLEIVDSGTALNVGSVGDVNGITASGNVKLVTDRLSVTNKVTTPNDLIIYAKMPGKAIHVGSTDVAGTLFLNSSYFSNPNLLGGTYRNIILGDSSISGDVNITDPTSFSSNVIINTQDTGAANLNGNVTIGPNGSKDLTITAGDFSNTGNIKVNNLTLNIKNGLAGLGGHVFGSGDLFISNPGTTDIHITDDTSASSDYKILYSTLNNVLTGFSGFNIKGNNDIYLEDGSLTASLVLTAANDIKVTGDARIDGNNLDVSATSANFAIEANKSLTVNGSGSDVKITTGTTTLGASSTLNSGSGRFTLTTDTLNADPTAKINGTGSLTLQQKDLGRNLYVVGSTNSQNGLVITNDQLNGGLFGNGFSDLTLGNINGTGTVTVDGLSVDNNVSIQTGGEITIGSGNLTIINDRRITLKGTKITNSGNSIDAGAGTINLYADTLNLSGTGTVIGSGTLGIGTFKGDKSIYLGNVATGASANDLELPDNYFTGSTSVFSSNFTHYSIGNNSQGNIYVNDSNLTKNTTLTAQNIAFNGDISVGSNTLTLNASNKSEQTGGVITAGKLALLGKNHNLTFSTNDIGSLAGNANQVKVKSNTLKIEDITTPGGIALNGISATGTGIGSNNDAVYLHTTDTSASPALTVNKNITADRGNITLVSDTMAFDDNARVAGHGLLTVQQHSSDSTLGIGGGADGTLQLSSKLFNGDNRIFTKGFSTVYLGREDSTAAVELNGDLEFVDNTIIRAGGNNGSITVKNNANISILGKTFEFRTKKLSSELGYSINTGEADFTITADELDLAGTSNRSVGAIYGDAGKGSITLKTYDLGTDIYLGNGFSGTGSGLYLNSGYFDGTDVNRVFQGGYEKIIIGQAEGTGQLTQYGTTTFDDEVIIRQATNNTHGGVNVRGTIYTNGKNFSVESQKVDIDAQINAGAGNIALTTDKLTISETSTINSTGDLSFNTYTPGADISFDDGSSGLVLKKEWFTGDNIFQSGFNSVTIGGENLTGTIDVSGLELGQGFTKDLILKNSGSGQVTAAGLNMADVNLNIESDGVISMNGVVSISGGKVSASSTNESISFDNSHISNLDNIKAGKSIKIKNTGALTIGGTVKGNTKSFAGQTVDLATDGNLTIGSNGSITANSNVYLTAENGHFINQNTGSASSVLNASGTNNRWVIFTKDSIGDEYGNLAFDFRRYGTDYGDTSVLTNTYSGNGAAHKYQPTATIYSEKVYGDAYGLFFTSDKFNLTISDWADRESIDRSTIENGITDSNNYSMGTGFGVGTNVNINDVNAYGTAYGSGSNLYASYTGDNPLNYNVEIQLRVTPKEVTVTANNDSKVYDGTSYSGGNGVEYKGFVNGQGIEVLNNGSIKFFGTAQSALNAGTYGIGLQGSDLTAQNYTFKYVDGDLTITPRTVQISANDATKIYGDANPLFSGFTAETAQPGSDRGLVGTDTISSVTNMYDSSIDQYTNAGQYNGTVTASNPIFSSGLSSNYTFEYVAGDLTIDKAVLTIAADNKHKVQNSDNPLFTVQYIGFKNNDNANSLTGLNITSPATKTSPSGIYEIVPSGAWSDNYEVVFKPGQLTIYSIRAIEDVKTITNSNNLNRPESLTPALPFNIISSLAPSVPPDTNATVISESNGSSSQRTFVSEGAGFALQISGANDVGDGVGHYALSKTSGAVPVLFAKDGEQKLDAIYVINYNPDKLAILPAAQGITIPSLDEVLSDVSEEFSIVYQSFAAGSFEVSYGNGIVSIKPLDGKALETLTADDKDASKAVLANGILMAIEDLGVIPDQIRAVYIFIEKK